MQANSEDTIQTVLPSITMGNVRSLPNKMHELAMVNTALDGFLLMWLDRTRESGKWKGGGLVVFIDGHIAIKTVLVRPCYLPSDFWYVLMIAVCIPLSANVDLNSYKPTSDFISSVVNRLQTQHLHGLLLVLSDFMLCCPLLCPQSLSALHDAPDTVKYWLYSMSTRQGGI